MDRERVRRIIEQGLIEEESCVTIADRIIAEEGKDKKKGKKKVEKQLSKFIYPII